MKYTIIGLFFISFSLTHSLIAQDSVRMPEPVEEEIITTDSMHLAQENYLKAGYYNHIPHYQNFAETDTLAFAAMKAKYQEPEFNYDEDVSQTNIFERAWNRISKWLQNLLPDMGFLRFSDIFYKLLALVAIVVFILVAYRVLFSGKRWLANAEKENEEDTAIRFVEKNLLHVDLAKYIDQAIKDDNYPLAIRYLNLLNIQLLAKKEVVKWKHTKTNLELLGEIADTDLRTDFERNVAIFDRVWFGRAAIDREKYGEYASYFLQFQSKWK